LSLVDKYLIKECPLFSIKDNVKKIWLEIKHVKKRLQWLGHQSFTLDSKRNFQDDSGNACGRKICSLIWLEKTRELGWLGFIERQPKMTPSPQVCPLWYFLLKCPHSRVMYITIYPFALALISHTLLTTACLSSRACLVNHPQNFHFHFTSPKNIKSKTFLLFYTFYITSIIYSTKKTHYKIKLFHFSIKYSQIFYHINHFLLLFK
jgi:hypothetical protein